LASTRSSAANSARSARRLVTRTTLFLVGLRQLQQPDRDGVRRQSGLQQLLGPTLGGVAFTDPDQRLDR
jgi:hypothetical protein